MEIEEKIQSELNSMTWGKAFKWFLMVLTVILVVSIVSGIFSTVSTVATAPGRVIKQTMQTDNIIQKYEWFYDVNAAYDSRVNQIVQFKGFYADETDKPEKSRLRMEMAAVQQTCRDLSTKYNANSQKMNTSIFKGWSLPKSLTIANCE